VVEKATETGKAAGGERAENPVFTARKRANIAVDPVYLLTH
jgi:hypothetical protein